jgi:hypothetical protein
MTNPKAAEPPITSACCQPHPECDHDFKGWREFADGRGGERVCSKCGIGAMAHTLRTGL